MILYDIILPGAYSLLSTQVQRKSIYKYEQELNVYGYIELVCRKTWTAIKMSTNSTKSLQVLLI